MCIGTVETTTFTVGCGGDNIPSEKSMARGFDVELLDEALFDYQYNTVLLWIEKQDSSSMFDRLRQELTETGIVLKQDQLCYLISSLSEAEENLRNALNTEQCKTDLQHERSLRELQEELSRVQSSSYTKLDESHALVDGIDEKSSMVNKKLHDAEDRLAEVNRKNAELDMKLREVEVCESLLQKERLSLATDRESFETAFYKQREDLKEWERKLQQREDMLCDYSQNLGEREKNVIETEENLKQKGRDLEVLENNIDSANSLLKEKEADIIRRVADVDAEEKKVDSVKRMLEMKEKELHALELKLSAREIEGIQKFHDEKMDTLVLKLQQFELEMEQMWNEQNKELETKLTSLKEKEKTMEIKEKTLEQEKEKLLADWDSLEKLNVELVKIKAEIFQQELQICQETANLKLTQDERSEHSRLQLELKQEIEHTRMQKDFIMKEAENLRVERLSFEKEWEELEKKRAKISGEQQEIYKKKERLRKMKNSEEKRLKREKQMKKVKNEKAQMLQDFEWKTRNFENEIQKRMEKMEKDLQEREREFQEEMERKLNIINILKDATENKWEEVNFEEIRLEIERNELEINKQQLKSELEMLELDKESFSDSIKQEVFLFFAMIKFVKSQMCQRFEEMEKDMQERERKFQEVVERELNNINIMKDATEKEWEEGKISESDVNVVKVEEPASSSNIETPHLQSDNTVREVKNEFSLSMDDHNCVESLIGGGPDDSQQSVPKVGRHRPGRKSKSGIARTCSVKAAEEAKEFFGKTSKEIENVSLQSLSTDHIKENSREESSHTEKVIGNSTRKRQRAQTFRIEEGEQNTANSEGHSDSITADGRKKKRKTGYLREAVQSQAA